MDAVDASVSVAVTSRCLGGEALCRQGVGSAGALSAQKGRIELALALSQSDDPLAYFESE